MWIPSAWCIRKALVFAGSDAFRILRTWYGAWRTMHAQCNVKGSRWLYRYDVIQRECVITASWDGCVHIFWHVLRSHESHITQTEWGNRYCAKFDGLLLRNPNLQRACGPRAFITGILVRIPSFNRANMDRYLFSYIPYRQIGLFSIYCTFIYIKFSIDSILNYIIDEYYSNCIIARITRRDSMKL